MKQTKTALIILRHCKRALNKHMKRQCFKTDGSKANDSFRRDLDTCIINGYRFVTLKMEKKAVIMNGAPHFNKVSFALNSGQLSQAFQHQPL